MEKYVITEVVKPKEDDDKTLQDKIEDVKSKYRMYIARILAHRNEAIAAVREKGKEFGEGLADEGIGVLEDRIDEIKKKSLRNIKQILKLQGKELQKVIANTKKKGRVAGTVLIVGSILAAGVKVARTLNQKAREECKNKHGAQKQQCIKTFKKEAVRRQIAFLSTAINHCKNAEDPLKCKMKINKRIEELKQKMAEPGKNIASAASGGLID